MKREKKQEVKGVVVRQYNEIKGLLTIDDGLNLTKEEIEHIVVVKAVLMLPFDNITEDDKKYLKFDINSVQSKKEVTNEKTQC
jgi:hypothetical protein